MTVYFEGEEIVHTRVAYQNPGNNSGAPDKIDNSKYKVETYTLTAAPATKGNPGRQICRPGFIFSQTDSLRQQMLQQYLHP